MGCPQDKVHLGAVFYRDLKMSDDGLDLVELVMRAEYEFKISIKESVSDKIVSVQDLVLAVAGYVINPAFHDAMPAPIPAKSNSNHEGNMSIWKILGGVAVGVGAVAAAPFTGGGSVLAGVSLMGSLAGASTVAAAVGAGAVGGAIGASMGGSDEGSQQERERANRAEEKLAQKAAEAERLRKDIERVKPHAEDMKKLHEFIVAAFAVGICAANCDGEIHPEERAQIEEFVAGISSAKLPTAVTRAIADLYSRPPTVFQALKYVEAFGAEDLEKFEDVVELTIHADGKVHPKEQAFLEAWSRTAEKLGLQSRFGRSAASATA